MGLFFMTVGVSIDVALFADQALRIILLTLALIAVKGMVLYALGFAFRLRGVTGCCPPWPWRRAANSDSC